MRILNKLESTNAKITKSINTLDSLRERNEELEAKCKGLELSVNNLNVTNKKLLETIDGLQSDLDNKTTTLHSLQSQESEKDKVMSDLAADLNNEVKAREKAETDLKILKEKQEKLIELLHRMEKDRDKKTSSKKESALAQQYQEMKESIEMLTAKLEEVKDDYDEKIVA